MDYRNQEDKNDFENFIDTSIREQKFKDIGILLNKGIDSALDFTKNTMEKILDKDRNIPYSIQNDDRIINQSPKAEKTVVRNGYLFYLSLFIHIVMLIGSVSYADMSDIILIAVWIIPAIAASLYGLKRNKLTKDQIIRFRKYKREIGNNTVVPVRDLAVAVAKSIEFTINDLLDLINKDYFRQARIVENGELFILDSNTYKLYKEEVINRDLKPTEKTSIEDKNEANELLEKAKMPVTELASIAEIINEPMKSKITELLSTIRKIFKQVKENPENAKDLDKFIQYYIPTTVKLSRAYIDMQESKSDSIGKSLEEIEMSMDTINYASLKLLENMYEDKAMDISSDISVLKTMLKQEGLLDTSDFNIRR